LPYQQENVCNGIQFQEYIRLHCATCNVLLSRRDIQSHLTWPTHIEVTDTCTKLHKRKRQKDIKNGALKIDAETVKEKVYDKVKEPKYEIVTYMTLDTQIKGNKDKIVIINNIMLKIAWENWNGIVPNKTAMKCIVCQIDLVETYEHTRSEEHRKCLKKPIDRNYSSHLMRKVSFELCEAQITS
jgi:hypothetical protein